MVFYFIRKYIHIWLVFVIGLTGLAIFFARMPLDEALPRGVLWGGVFAAGQLYREFKKKNLWPLYDNLRITKFVLLGCTILVNTVLALGIRMWQL